VKPIVPLALASCVLLTGCGPKTHLDLELRSVNVKTARILTPAVTLVPPATAPVPAALPPLPPLLLFPWLCVPLDVPTPPIPPPPAALSGPAAR